MSTRLFVGNISAGVCEDDLKKEFSFYGKVVGVDLKRKRDANDEGNENQFAFVTLDTDNLNINKCVSSFCMIFLVFHSANVSFEFSPVGIQEFSDQKWKGSFLNVTIAKESFLDRLKRERTEAEKPKVLYFKMYIVIKLLSLIFKYYLGREDLTESHREN